MRLRTPIFVPGNRQRMLQKAAGFEADCLVLDLEDSVPAAEKENARLLVAPAIPILAAAGHHLAVRINSLDTGLAPTDIAAVIGSAVEAISVGKIRSVAEIREYDRLLADAESKAGLPAGRTKLIPWLETPAGIIRAFDIASATTRVVAVAFGAEDYTRELGIERTADGTELSHARATVALAAHAAGVVPLDTPYMEIRDLAGLEKDAGTARQLGFKGKFAVHPDQIPVIRAVFSPRPEEVEYARRVVGAWETASAAGRGAIDFEGRLIDVPVVERARKLIREAGESAG